MKNQHTIDQSETRPWGFWATLGFSIICFIAMAIVGGVVLVMFCVAAYLSDSSLNVLEYLSNAPSNGLILWVTSLITMPVCCGLIFLFVKLRKGYTLRQYLNVYPVSGRELLIWTVIILGLCGISDLVAYLTDNPIVPQFTVDAYKSAYFLPGLLLIILVAGPIQEELFFRGFMFKGFQSRIGNIWTVLLTSSLWSIIHVQYDLYQITTIFVLGIILGVARIKTNSIYTTTVLHFLNNLIATIELMVKVYLLS